MTPVPPKPVYTVTELAEKLGISRRACIPLLVKMGIPIRPGKPRYVWLSDIQAAAPEMYASWAESERLRASAEASS